MSHFSKSGPSRGGGNFSPRGGGGFNSPRRNFGPIGFGKVDTKTKENPKYWAKKSY